MMDPRSQGKAKKADASEVQLRWGKDLRWGVGPVGGAAKRFWTRETLSTTVSTKHHWQRRAPPPSQGESASQ